MTSHSQHFEQFMKQREKVAKAYVTGDAEPLSDISTDKSPATFFGPMGGYIQGANEVLSTNIEGSTHFGEESESHFEILHMGSSGDLAYWVGIQHAEVKMKGKKDTIPMHLRVTELFRREGEEWKLVHRHADELASENKK